MFRTDGIGEPDENDDGRLKFVGRFREREEIKTALRKRKNRLIQISGAPNIGKQELVHQICEELIIESCQGNDGCNLHVSNISCKFLRTYDDLIEKVFDSLQELETDVPDSTSKIKRVISIIKSHFIESNFLLLTFTKLDNFLCSDAIPGVFDKFLDLCRDILRMSRNTFLIVSNQTRLKLNIGYIPRHLCLSKLTIAEATSLIQQASPDVDFENFEKDIVKGCHCIPGLILEAASIIVHSDGIVTPNLLSDLLKSPQNALDLFSSPSHSGAKEEHLRNKIDNLLKRLPNELQSSVHDLMVLRGSFSSDAMAAVLGHKHESVTTVQVILPLKSSSVLDFDRDTNLYSFNPLLRAYLDEIPLVSSSDLARLRFVKFFADTMATVDQHLYKDSHKSAEEYFHFDYANVQQVMQQALHCNEDIFKVLMKAVSEAEELFIKCFPVERVKDFYNHLLEAAQLFGTPKEMAILKMFLAQAMMQLKVDTNRSEITRLFREAYSTFSTLDHHDYHHMTLLGFMGRFIIRQGKYRDGLGYIERALNMKVDANQRTRVHRRTIEFLVQQALGELFSENYDKSEVALNLAHDIAQKEAPYHEAVALISNTFGLICDRSGRDEDKALQWYKSSLSERRKYEKFAPGMLVAPLNNIASQSLKRGNYGYAMKLIEEALKIRKSCGWNDYYTGLTLRQKAEIHMAKGQIELAITTCDEAFKICQQCTPTHYFLDDIRLLRFHCHVISKDWSSADEVYELIMAGRERYSRDTERGELMMKAMLHSLFLTEGDDWDNAYNDLQVEIRKLRDLAFECNDFDKYHLLQLKINHGSRLFTSKRVDTQDIHKQKCRDFVTEHCHLCKMSRFD